MATAIRAIEARGEIDANSRLFLESPLGVRGPLRVRVIILIPEEGDIDEREWAAAAAANPCFAFLKDPAEDLYSVADGEPFDASG